MVKSRLGRDHPIVRLVECHHAENGLIPREMVVDCPIVITSIGDTLFQTKKIINVDRTDRTDKTDI